MNKAFLSYFKHFETFLGKMYLVLTPRKTAGRVPNQQGAPATCNLTYCRDRAEGGAGGALAPPTFLQEYK